MFCWEPKLLLDITVNRLSLSHFQQGKKDAMLVSKKMFVLAGILAMLLGGVGTAWADLCLVCHLPTADSYHLIMAPQPPQPEDCLLCHLGGPVDPPLVITECGDCHSTVPEDPPLIVMDCHNFSCHGTVAHEDIVVTLDIKPGSCPNPFNVNSKGVLPVAILGTVDFDVRTIDPPTIKITRKGINQKVSPLRWAYEDVATPNEGELCECLELNGDGYLDLTLKFDCKEVTEALKLWQVLGQTIPLTITGNLKEEYEGTQISGQDCGWIKPKVKGKAKLKPVGESGVYGKAKLVTRNDGTTKIVLKKFTGLTAGGTYQAKVRSGSCNGVILFTLSDVIVNQGGVGRSDAVVDATIDFDTWWIEVGGVTCGKVKFR